LLRAANNRRPIQESTVKDPIRNVLFLCTGNSARSILAEALLNHLGAGRFRAFSAGSRPAGRVNPFAVQQLTKEGLSVSDLRSKSWDEFAAPQAPTLDVIITVCDNAAGETCPVWPGHPSQGHWGIEDPAAVEGDDEAKRAAFALAYARMERRIRRFLQLPLDALRGADLQRALDDIGRLREQGQ
jgi:protein-tyrosine-phosphatase